MPSLIYSFINVKNGVVLAIMLVGCFQFSEGFSQKTLGDSLKQQLDLHRTEDTLRVNLHIRLSHHYFGVDQVQSQSNAAAALKLAEKLRFQKGIAKAKIWMAMNSHLTGDDEMAVKYALSAEATAEKNGSKGLLAESYRTLAVIYTDLEDLNRAENYYIKADIYARDSDDFGLRARILNGLGSVQMRRKKHKEALKQFFQGLAIASQHQMSFYLPLILSNIGETYGTETFTNRALQEKYYHEALAQARKSQNRYAEATILSNIGQMLTRLGKYADSEVYLDKSLKMFKEIGVKNGTQKVYLKLVELSLKQNDFPAAKQYIDEYYELKNTLMSEEKSRQIVKLEEQFKSEKREQKIKLLEQEKRLQIVSKNFWIIGSVLLFIAAAIIYYLQQSRNRKAKQLLAMQKTLIAKLEETDMMKSRFFANISHEFRTPLSLILAPVEEMIKSSKSGHYDHNDLKMVKRNANRLLDLVNQLLDLSKLEAGKMSLQIQRSNLSDWLRILAASFDSLAEAKKINFEKYIELSETNVWFDKDKLEKIITNILSNAFKFTGAGGHVSLSIRTGTDNSELHISLADNGIGIAKEDLPHVFSPFYQVRLTSEDSQPGTGLGLALVSELVKLHRGEIDFTSEHAVGTLVEIKLPLSRKKLDFAEEISEEASAVVFKKQSREGFMTIDTEPNPDAPDCLLIVEDNPELRNFIAHVFHDHFKVVTAPDGEQGLQTAIQLMPDLIISDVMMPRMDGITMTQQLKEHEMTSHIPVLLLTAKSDSESRMEGLRTGAEDYLAKPFSTEELRVRVENLIKARKKLAAIYRTEIMLGKPKERILSFDDKFVQTLRATIEMHLGDPSFSVEQLAGEMCLSRTQLFRKVKALLDISPNELINDMRLQRAAVLIRSKADSLTQISYSVGFSEQSYFAKRFRKKYGVSPTEYANA